MVDPLSISASVAGLISLAAAVTKSCYGMYREIRNAPRGLKDIIDELGLLSQVLTDLKDICDQRSEPLLPLENVLKDIHACGKRLKEFETSLGLKFRHPRSILSRVRWSLGGSEVKAFVDQLHAYRGMFESAKSNATLQLAMAIRNDVRSESLLQDIARKEARIISILEWLSPLDFSGRQHDFYDTRREPGTSEWIEREESFIQWRDHAVPYSNDFKRTLWCRGNPGSGKTIACSVLIDNLLQLRGDVGVAYMYCFGQDQAVQTAEALVGSLIKQMVLLKIEDGNLPTVVEDLYRKTGLNGKPNLGVLVKVLKDITDLFDRAFIVADGVDELEKETSQKLLNCAHDMIPENRTKFLIASRPSAPRITKYLRHGFSIDVKASDADVRVYLTHQIRRNDNLEMLIGNDVEIRKKIIAEISQQCQGQ